MAYIFLTGAAGFIGSTAALELLKEGEDLIIIDNFNNFYNPKIKEENIKEVFALAKQLNREVKLIRGDIRDKELINSIYKNNDIKATIAWAAMAGVRPSIEDPDYYADVNINGLVSILEAMRLNASKKLVFISSSSVYGNNLKVPFKETDNVDHPISPYAATKKAGEILCYTYHHLFKLDIHCLRYFTVYGPKQRPDLAINKFTRLMLENKKIPMYGDGSTSRDYTFVLDIVRGTILSYHYLLSHDDVYDIFNLGGSNPITLKDLIYIISKELKVEPQIEELPMQQGDVNITYSDYSHAKEVLGYEPKIKIEEGIHQFAEWYKNHYQYYL